MATRRPMAKASARRTVARKAKGRSAVRALAVKLASVSRKRKPSSRKRVRASAR